MNILPDGPMRYGVQAGGGLFGVGLGTGVGCAVAAVTGLANPLNAAVFLLVNGVVMAVTGVGMNAAIDRYFENDHHWLTKTVAKVVAFSAVFFVSSVLSALIVSAIGFTIGAGTAVALSLLTVITAITALVTLGVCCCPCIVGGVVYIGGRRLLGDQGGGNAGGGAAGGGGGGIGGLLNGLGNIGEIRDVIGQVANAGNDPAALGQIVQDHPEMINRVQRLARDNPVIVQQIAQRFGIDPNMIGQFANMDLNGLIGNLGGAGAGAGAVPPGGAGGGVDPNALLGGMLGNLGGAGAGAGAVPPGGAGGGVDPNALLGGLGGLLGNLGGAGAGLPGGAGGGVDPNALAAQLAGQMGAGQPNAGNRELTDDELRALGILG